MSKKNKIAYIKPREPSFITRMKQEANYKEGPTVETKVSPLFRNYLLLGSLNWIIVLYSL